MDLELDRRDGANIGENFAGAVEMRFPRNTVELLHPGDGW